MVLTVFAVNLYETGIFTTWQAMHIRKIPPNMRLHVGIPKPFDHTSCGCAFLRNA